MAELIKVIAYKSVYGGRLLLAGVSYVAVFQNKEFRSIP